MKNKIKNLIKIFTVVVLTSIAFLPAGKIFAAVDLNSTTNEGVKILEIGNFTKTPGSTNWQNYSINADAGDIISLLIHYHNFTSGEVAKNVKVMASIPSGTSTSQIFSINLWADNSLMKYSDSVTANITSGQSVSFIPGSVVWYPKGGTAALPSGQTGNEITTALGVNIGDVKYGDPESGYISLKIQISGTPTAPAGDPPIVFTNSAANITANSAILRGNVNPKASATEVWFQWGTVSEGLIRETNHQNMGDGNSYSDFLNGISGLTNNTPYIFRAVAKNANGTTYGSTLSFTTLSGGGGGDGGGGCLPIVTTNGATFITKNSATLRGLVNPSGRSTSGWFEYGKSYSLTNRTEQTNIGSGYADTDFIRYLANLEQNSTYYFRAVAENNCGRAQGSVLSFTTEVGAGNAPAVTTLSATDVTDTTAIFNAKINPNNSSTLFWFEWGTNLSLSSYSSTVSINAGADNILKEVSGVPSFLSPKTKYYFRIAAQNIFGTSRGNILSFTTLGAEPVVPPKTGVSFSLLKEVKNLTSQNGTSLVNSASSGDTIEYLINVKNRGANALKNIIVKDDISSHYDFIEASPSTSIDSFGNSLRWNINSISSGETKTISLKLKVKKVEESVVAYNLFSAKAGGVEKTSNQTTTIINPSLLVSCEPEDNGLAAIGRALKSLPWWLYGGLILIALILFARYRISKIAKA